MTSKEAMDFIKNYILKYKGRLNVLVKTAFELVEQDLEALEIIKKHTLIQKNGDGFTITVWFNTENCDFKSCASMEEILKVRKVLEEK